MLRASLAVIASLILVGILGLLIVESRSVDQAYFAAHTERVRAIEATREDLNDILFEASNAHQDGRSVPASVTAALQRVNDNNQLLQSAASNADTRPGTIAALGNYDAALTLFSGNANIFIERQDALSDALRLVQEESPIVVKDLRRFDLPEQSQSAFSLAIDVIEFASGQGRANPEELATRIDDLRSNAAVELRAPGRVDAFVAAATAVIEEHAAASEALTVVSTNRIADSLWAASDAVQSDNRRTVSRAERARLLLSVCTLVLLAGIAYVVYRLQSSYRDLNRSNSELAAINNSLEERVSARTEQLTSAYDELQESQVQLVQAEKMSSLGELVAGISHEINTPLWYLINNATIIEERLGAVSELTTTAEDMITAVRSGDDVKTTLQQGLRDMQAMLADGMKDDIDEAGDLIKDSIEGLEDLTELAQSLKDFSRLDRAQQGQFNVNDGLEKTLLITKNKLKNKVTVHKHFGEVPAVFCSPSQINQVFLNLITNAADAIEEQGEVVVRTWAEDDTVKVSVADSGCGIPDDLLDKIRDPFFTTKEVGKGTGLGLSIVDRIVSSHNGELSIESEVGKGTVITVTLPQQVSGELESTDLAAELKSSGADGTVLEMPATSIADTDNEHDSLAGAATA